MAGFLKFSGFKRILNILPTMWIVGYDEDSNIRFTFSDLIKQLNVDVSTSQGAPIYFEGNQLPDKDNLGNDLSKGNWVFVTEGTYQNINGGSEIIINEGNFGYIIYNGTTWILGSSVPLPKSDNKDVAGNIFSYNKNMYLNRTTGAVLTQDTLGIGVSPLLKLSKEKDIVILGYSNAVSIALVAFYDVNGIFISSISGASYLDVVTTVKKEDFPANALYYRGCGRINTIDSYIIHDDLAQTRISILANYENLNKSAQNVGDIITYNDVVTGFYVGINGAITPSGIYQISGIQPCPKGNVLYKGMIGANAGISYYNKVGEVIGGYRSPDGTEISNFELTIPSDAVFWNCSSRVGTPISYVAKTKNNAIATRQEAYKNVADLESAVFTIVGYINKVNGEKVRSNGYRCTPPIYISGKKDIEIYGFDGAATNAVSLVYFYDLQGNPLSAYTTNKYGLQRATIKKEDIPAGARYIRASASILDISKVYVYGAGISGAYAQIGDLNDAIVQQKNTLKNNISTQKTSFSDIETTGTYGQSGASYKIPNKSKNGILRVAFEFKINEDVNRSSAQKSVVKFEKPYNVPTSALTIQTVGQPLQGTVYQEVAYGTTGAVRTALANGTVIMLSPTVATGNAVSGISYYTKDTVNTTAINSFIDFFLQENPTSIFTGVEAKNKGTTIVTNSPLPYFNSGFGIKSNVSIGGNRLNAMFNARRFEYDGVNGSSCYKPLAGDDLFSIRISAVDSSGNNIVDTRSTEAQTILEKWENAFIEITDTEIKIVNSLLSINYVFTIANYATYWDLFTAIKGLDGVISNGAKINITDINSIAWEKYDVTKLLRFKAFLASKYPATEQVTTQYFIDSFPCYVSYAINEEWHSFEFVTTPDPRNAGTVAIDGQYLQPGQDIYDFNLGSIKDFVAGGMITIGGELPITVKNLICEFNETTDAELKLDVPYNNFIISSLHPYLYHIYTHDLFKINPVLEANLIRNFEVNGGSIPNKYMGAPGYRGDDNINQGRQQLANPSYYTGSVLQYAKEKGYTYIDSKDYERFVTTGVYPNKRMFMIGFDDHHTYIYADRDLREMFNKNGARAYHALELGYYVTNDTPTTSYNANDWIINGCKDTNEHREMLKRRIATMQADGWDVQIHGNKEGFVFQGKTYNEIIAAIQESLNICEYLGIQSHSWCYAGNYYTPNAIKLLEYNGISFATSTVHQVTGRCHHPNYLPRGGYGNESTKRRLIF